MAKVVILDREKRVKLFLRKMKEKRKYRFSIPVKSKVIPKGEDEPRSPTFSFFGGVFVGYAKERECLIFVGTPLNDIGGLGECRFFVPIDTKATLTLIEEKKREK